jgi:hypothetical protein
MGIDHVYDFGSVQSKIIVIQARIPFLLLPSCPFPDLIPGAAMTMA